MNKIFKRKNIKFITSAVSILLFTFLFMNYTDILSNSDDNVFQGKKLPKVEREKARSDYFFNILRDPATNEIPKNIRSKELEFANNLQSKQLNKSAAASFDWVEAGPVDVGGRTRALAVDRRNTNVILAGGINGGIWKSTDKGTTWSLKSDPSLDLSVTYLTQDYANPDVWYYSSGEYDQSANDRGFKSKIYGTGIYKSTNNGESWVQIQSANNPIQADTPYDFISKILVSESTGSVFISSNLYGIYRSTDGGANFTKVFGAAPQAVIYYEMDIASNGNILVTASNNTADINDPINGVVYLLTNDGDDSEDITPDGYNDFSGVNRGVVAIAPSNNNIAYLWVDGEDNDFNNITKFFKFDLNDISSEDRSNNLPDFGGDVGNIDTQGSYNMIIAVKPDDENYVFFGATNLYRSDDGFSTPADNEFKNWIGGYATSNDISKYQNHHPDQHSLFFEPGNPNALWSGHDGGLAYTTNISVDNASINWLDKNRGYNVTQYYKVGIHESDGNLVVGGGAQDNGSPVFQFNNNTASNSTDFSSGDGAFIYIGDNFLISSSQEGFIIRNDFADGGSFSYIKPTDAKDVLFIHPFAVDQNNDDYIYYPEGKKLWRNTSISTIQNQDNQDGTMEGWTLLGDVDGAADYRITYLTTSKSPANILFIGLSEDNSAPKILKLNNANTATSGYINISIPEAASGAYVHDISVNPNNADEFLVVLSNYNIKSIFYTNNGGQSYSAVDGNLKVTATIRDLHSEEQKLFK